MNTRLFPHVIAAIILLLISGFCFQDLLQYPSDVLVGIQSNGYNDTTSQFIAFKNYQNVSLEQNNEFPFWNPYSLLGMPWLGTPQSSLFYPGNWLFYITNALTTISWSFVLHHWWAGLGAYFLGRKYQLNFFSSLLSGIIFLSVPYFVAKTGEGHFTSVTQIAWFPWILLGYEFLREGSKKGIPALAVLISLAFFCGHVQELYYLLLFLSASIVFESLTLMFLRKKQKAVETPSQNHLDNENKTISPGVLFKGWLIVGFLTLGLVAIDLFPVFVYTKQAVRSGSIDLDALREGSLTSASMLQLVDPFVWGDPAKYTGPGTYYWEAICYFGCLPLLLAFLGVLSSIKNRSVIRLTLIGLGALLLAFGPHLPLYTICYQIIPGFSMFRFPARLLWICSLAIAMLAGFGCESVTNLFLHKKRKLFRRASVIGFGAVLLLSSYSWFQFEGYLTFTTSMNQIIKLQMFYFIMAIFGITIAVVISSYSRKAAIGGAIILCGVSSWELFHHSHQILRTIPNSSFRDDTTITTFLKTNLGQQRVLVTQKLLSDREAWEHQFLKVQGYEPVPLVRLGLLAAAAFPQPDAATVMAGFSTPRLKTARPLILDLMSIKYAILQTDRNLKLKGWRTVSSGTIPEEFAFRGSEVGQLPYLIMENENPLPRAFIVGETRPINPSNESKMIVSAISKVQPRKEVLLQKDILPTGKRQTYKAAKILKASSNTLTIQANLDAPGYLIITDIYYPGWTAQVNDSLIPILPADFSLRAIPLPKGNHEVNLSFTPPGFKFGRLISIITLVIILVLLLRPLRSSQKNTAN